MKTSFLAFTTVLALAILQGNAGVEILPDRPLVPMQITTKGKVLEALGFKDAGGENAFFLFLHEKGKPGEDFESRIQAVQRTRWKPGTPYKDIWKLRDGSSHSLESIAYAKGQSAIEDIDGDGWAEVVFWYSKVSDGADPDTLKLMAYSKGRKYAVRGLVPKTAEDLSRYERNPDRKVSEAPEAIRKFLFKKWDALVKPELEALKEEPVTPTVHSELAFTPLSPYAFTQTGKGDSSARIPQALGTPPQLFWIRGEKGLERFGLARSTQTAAFPVADESMRLDFARHDLIFLSMGVQGTTGYSLRLESIRSSGQEVRFLATTTGPGPRDAVGEALTHPALLARVDKLPKEARVILVLDGKEAAVQPKILD